MNEPRPWSGFDRLADALAAVQAKARDAAACSLGEILTQRNWLIGAWIVAYEQEGADRARYGDGPIDALAQAFLNRGIRGLGLSNLRDHRQLALTWPRLGIHQTPSGESRLPAGIWQPQSAESLPAVSSAPSLPSQDGAWMTRQRGELSFSHLLELTRVKERRTARIAAAVTGQITIPEFAG